MKIVIQTCEQGVLFIKLPLIREDIDEHNTVLNIISQLQIQVKGPYPKGELLGQEMLLYLKGDIPQFHEYTLIWNKITIFEKRVLSALKNIPYGKTGSYSEVAIMIGCPSAARAVGQALKKNPWPILLPCHRVIGKNGELKGFSSGQIWKRILLNIEKSVKGVDE
jgi:O-6-methylguanine DNA methyltransferase